MQRPETPNSKLTDAICLAVSLLVFAICVFYIDQFMTRPNASFDLEEQTWQVLRVDQPCPGFPICLQPGDRILQIGELTYEQAAHRRTVPFLRDFRPGSPPVSVKFRRGGEVLITSVEVPASSPNTLADVLSAWLIPLIFWLSGTIAALSLRPRDERWLILIAVLWVTAIWTISGMASHSRMGWSIITFHVAIWCFVPLLIHLHVILPEPLRSRHHRLVMPLYLIAGGFLTADLARWIPGNLYLAFALVAILVSLAILVVRSLRPASPGVRLANRSMSYGVALGIGPFIVMIIVSTIESSATHHIIFLTVPLWPLTYLYALSRNISETLELRANRLLGEYGFLSLYAMIFTVIFAFFLRAPEAGDQYPFTASLLISLLFIAAAPFLRARFLRLIDRLVFGVKYTPDEIVGIFAGKIPAAFDRDNLRRIIVEEILPVLYIRQSALYVRTGRGLEEIYSHNLPKDSVIPSDATEMEAILLGAAEPVGDREPSDSWIRLALPLSIQADVIGAWFLGKKDPDDFYSRSDTVLLQNLANLIAPVLEHLRLVEIARQEVAENKRLQKQLVQSQKMEAVGRLSSGVAHDFNNLLSVILGYCDLLLARASHDPQVEKHLSAIRNAGAQAAALTRQLLAFSRQQVMESRVMHLNDVITNVQEILTRVASEDIDLIFELDSDLPQVSIDPGQIGQVVINLAVNARDAMPGGGRIRIRTARSELAAGATNEGAEIVPGEYALLEVSDNGEGIEPDVLQRVFEPFFTTKDIGKGTGLGLSLVYGIVQQSSGYVFADSSPGEGATFRIYLPDASRRPASPRKLITPSRSSKASLSGKETILLVEDEESVRRVTCQILQARGYYLLEAASGREALEIFEQHEGRIDLLLTDVMMPKMRGPQLADELRGRDHTLRVLFMSGYNDEVLAEQPDGGVLIQKPFTPVALAEIVRDILDHERDLPEESLTRDTF